MLQYADSMTRPVLLWHKMWHLLSVNWLLLLVHSCKIHSEAECVHKMWQLSSANWLPLLVRSCKIHLKADGDTVVCRSRSWWRMKSMSAMTNSCCRPRWPRWWTWCTARGGCVSIRWSRTTTATWATALIVTLPSAPCASSVTMDPPPAASSQVSLRGWGFHVQLSRGVLY